LLLTIGRNNIFANKNNNLIEHRRNFEYKINQRKKYFKLNIQFETTNTQFGLARFPNIALEAMFHSVQFKKMQLMKNISEIGRELICEFKNALNET
jgi:hypothetical protein